MSGDKLDDDKSTESDMGLERIVVNSSPCRPGPLERISTLQFADGRFAIVSFGSRELHPPQDMNENSSHRARPVCDTAEGRETGAAPAVTLIEPSHTALRNARVHAAGAALSRRQSGANVVLRAILGMLNQGVTLTGVWGRSSRSHPTIAAPPLPHCPSSSAATERCTHSYGDTRAGEYPN